MKKVKKLAAYLLAIAMIITQFVCLCGVTVFADGLPSPLSDSFLHGVNLHNSGKQAYESVYSAILEARALGSNIIRFNYDPGEVGYNDDDLSYVASVADIASQYDMQFVLVLDGFNQIFTDDDDSYTNEVIAANYGVLANRLAGKVAYYQIGNEIDTFYYRYDNYGFSSKADVAQKAANALQAAKTAINSADSAAKIIMNFGWTHYEFLSAVYDLGYVWDITGLDWYSNMSQEAGVTYYQTVIEKVINDYGKPLMVCETGLSPTEDNGVVDYIYDRDWLCDFAKYCESNPDVSGFIIYELYDEGEPYVDDEFNKENCFGLFDYSKNEKEITPYIRALFGGEVNARIYNPDVPANSYSSDDLAIDRQGVAGTQGKLFSSLGENIARHDLDAIDISKHLMIEFDLYIEDYDAFMIAYNNAGFSNESGTSSLRFRLLSTTETDDGFAKVDLDINQITHSGWNHISVNYGKFGRTSFESSFVTGYDLYVENNGELANRNYLNATSGMVFAISNLYATLAIPEIIQNDNTYVIYDGVFAESVLGSAEKTGQAHLPGYSSINPAQVNFTNPGLADYGYFEFDYYAEDINSFNARKIKLYLNVRRTAGVSYGTFEFQDQITQNGWNHVKVAANLSSDNLNNIAIVRYYMDIDAGDAGFADYYRIANLCATKDAYSCVPAIEASEDCFVISEGAALAGTLGSSEITGQGHLPGYGGSVGPAEKQFTNPGLAGYDYFEFDYYVDDIDNFNARNVRLYLNVRAANNASQGTFEFGNKIVSSGWNHVKVAAALSDDKLNVITKARFYIDIDAGSTGATDRYRIANICLTKIAVPEKNNTMSETVGELNVGNGLVTSGWKEGRYSSAGCYQEGLSAVDLSGSEYIELDMYVESRQGILDAIADLDSKNGDSSARWRFMLSSIPGDYRGNNNADAYYLDNFEDYITHDGWNHVVIQVSEFTHAGSATLSSIASWGIDFRVATNDTNIAKDQKLAVYNICGTSSTAHSHVGGTATCHSRAVCTECGEEYGEFDPTNHEGGTEVRDKADATCTEAGYTGDTYCLGCGAKLATGEVIGALNHNFVDYVSDNNATCTSDGTKTAKCTRCDATDTIADAGSMLAHNVGEWITDANGHHRHCADCDQDVDAGEHTYEWVITKEATAEENGLREEICSVCGYKSGNSEEIIYSTHIAGDINGDGSLNNKDLTRLFQYLSDWDVEVNESALDVNGDGSVNNKDLTRLFQYLSDWDVEIF